MPRKCSICIHPKRADINKAVLSGKKSIRKIAAQFQDVTPGVLQICERLNAEHVPGERCEHCGQLLIEEEKSDESI